MKKLITSLLLMSLNVYSYPVGVQSQSGAAQYPALVKTPYNQVSKLPDNNSLIETGNENMLVDAGMESSGVAAWTCTVGTCSKTSVSGEFSSGKQALKVVLSAQSMNVSQTVNTPSGIQKQGYFRILYRIPASGIVTPTMTITVDSVLQTTVPSTSLIMDGTFRQIEVPLIFGSTNVKVSLLSGSSTGTVFFDAAIVAQGLGTQNLMLDNVYSAQVSATGVVSGESKDFINGNCAVTGTSVFTCTYTSNIFTVAPICTATITDSNARVIWSTTQSAAQVVFNTALSTTGVLSAQSFAINCVKSGNDYLASSANVYSQNSANYNETLYTPVTTGFGTISPATNACTHKRVLGDLEVKCSFLTGTTTNTFGTIKLPLSLSVDPSRLITGSNTNLQQGTMVGDFSVSSANVNGRMVTAAGTDATLVYIAGNFVGAATTAPQTSTSGAIGNNLAVNISFKVPIAGWSNSSPIVGSFAGTPKVPGYDGNVDTFSVSYGTTNATTNCTVSPCSYLDQIGSAVSTITRSSTGAYILNTLKTYANLKCTGVARSSTGAFENFLGGSCVASSSCAFSTGVSDLGTTRDTNGTLMCQGSY